VKALEVRFGYAPWLFWDKWTGYWGVYGSTEAYNHARLRASDQRICLLFAGKAGVSQAAS